MRYGVDLTKTEFSEEDYEKITQLYLHAYPTYCMNYYTLKFLYNL